MADFVTDLKEWTMRDPEIDAELEGYSAWSSGIARDRCPYEGTLWAIWQFGWWLAEQQTLEPADVW
jgi:ribosome modulation factor